MKDDLGIYYYPDPANSLIRMYVRHGQKELEFRLWHRDRPDVWEKHSWLPLSLIKASAKVYNQHNSVDPLHLYDEQVALGLLHHESRLV